MNKDNDGRLKRKASVSPDDKMLHTPKSKKKLQDQEGNLPIT